jgi:ATP-dependent Clp protease ATP-binding subunit ClpA
MFQRYATPTRRAIFFAREAALHAGSSGIDSTHLLSGLLVEQSTRVNTIFQLSQRFPEESARIRALKRFPQPRDIPLSKDGRRVVAGASAEANRLDDYWIDTDHLMLAILCEDSSPGAAMLNKAGFRLSEVRDAVSRTAGSREAYGPVPMLWRLGKPISRVGRIAGFLYLIGVVVLIRLLTEVGCGFKR